MAHYRYAVLGSGVPIPHPWKSLAADLTYRVNPRVVLTITFTFVLLVVAGTLAVILRMS